MIKNIIFDLAGVVLNLNLERDTAALKHVGLPMFHDFPNHPEILHPCMSYLNGLCTKDEFLGAIRPYCKSGVTDEDILWSMDAVLDDIPLDRIKRIIELKKHYNIYLLSNIYDTAWAYAVKEITSKGFSVEDLFHHTFLSYEMQLAKPDERIYKEVIRTTGIIPSETVYFDDSKENIIAGNKIGFKSVLVPMNQLEDCLYEALQ